MKENCLREFRKEITRARVEGGGYWKWYLSSHQPVMNHLTRCPRLPFRGWVRIPAPTSPFPRPGLPPPSHCSAYRFTIWRWARTRHTGSCFRFVSQFTPAGS